MSVAASVAARPAVPTSRRSHVGAPHSRTGGADGYGRAFTATAAVLAALFVLTALAVPGGKPAPGTPGPGGHGGHGH